MESEPIHVDTLTQGHGQQDKCNWRLARESECSKNSTKYRNN